MFIHVMIFLKEEGTSYGGMLCSDDSISEEILQCVSIEVCYFLVMILIFFIVIKM